MAGVVLSDRLQCLANMVTRGNIVADVGCDHGFLSIYLVQNHISPKVIAMDVRTGPLSQAKAHIEENLLTDYIETRLSDGINKLEAGEAQTLVIAGMGGPLMIKILSCEKAKTDSFHEMILQPQSEIACFRAYLRENGYCIKEEKIVLEEGKYYFPMRAVKKEETDGISGDSYTDLGMADEIQTLYDLYGELLIAEKNPLLLQYLKEKEDTLLEIINSLKEADKERAKSRLKEVEEELKGVRKVLQMMES